LHLEQEGMNTNLPDKNLFFFGYNYNYVVNPGLSKVSQLAEKFTIYTCSLGY